MAIDTRVTIFDTVPYTINSNATLTGTTIDLKSGYTGDYFEGAPVGYGLGVRLLFTSITGTSFNLAIKWQVSDDNSTWVDDQQVYSGEVVAAKGDNNALEIQTRLRTPRRYARLVIVSTNISSESCILKVAALSDGTTAHGFATQVLAV